MTIKHGTGVDLIDSYNFVIEQGIMASDFVVLMYEFFKMLQPYQ